MRLLLIILLCGLGVLTHAACVIPLKHPATRIITLAPHLTEIVFAIDGGDRVIATIAGSDYPVAANKIERIGAYNGIDLERIYMLHPDLMIAWGNQFAKTLSQLKKKGIAVYVSDPKHLTDVPKTMRELGCLLGKDAAANDAANTFSAKLAALKQQYANQKIKRVFFQIGGYSLLTINQDHWINDAIALCGGRNIYSDATLLVPSVSLESVIERNPEVIISDADNVDWQKRWRSYTQILATKNNRLISIQSDLIDRPGPRLIDGVWQICQQIHYSQIN